MAAVAPVDVLDDLLAAVALDVDVDVRRAVALGRQEALEQQTERHGIRLGDAEGVADRAVGRAASPLAEDVGAVAELDEVPHDEEVAGEAEALDHLELVVDGVPGAGPQREVFVRRRPLAVAVTGAGLDDAPQELHLRQAVRTRERRQVRGDEREVERSSATDLGGELDHAGVAQEAASLFGPAAQVRAGGSGQPRIQLVEAAPGAHRGDRGGQLALRRRGVVHVVGGHARHVVTRRELGERVVAHRVHRVAVIPQLDQHTVATEGLHQRAQLPRRGRWTVLDERGGHRALATTGEHPGVAGQRVRRIGQRELRRALLAGEVPEAQRARQPGVAVGPVGQHQEVLAVRVGQVQLRRCRHPLLALRVLFAASHPARAPAGRQRDLGAEHGGQADGAGGLGEADDAVKAIVIGDRQRLQPEAVGLLGQLLGVRCPVEEGEVAVAVQLGVRGGRAGAQQRLGGVGFARLEGLALAAPGRPVATGVPRRRPRGAPVSTANILLSSAVGRSRRRSGEEPFDLFPGHVGVVEAHRSNVDERTFDRKGTRVPTPQWRVWRAPGRACNPPHAGCGGFGAHPGGRRSLHSTRSHRAPQAASPRGWQSGRVTRMDQPIVVAGTLAGGDSPRSTSTPT